ncbi:MAG: 3'-5' exonuclease domain-containing protein 2 [Bacteroidales bacterium]|nr:3'-5' exonuclease domain-containing protein 2 [Bacteroidales bacterium]
MFSNTIGWDEINKLPLTYFEGQIFLIDALDSLFECLPLLNKIQVFGFDTETKPAFKKGKVNQIALLQLCTSDMAFLIRLNKIGLPGPLQEILSNPDIIKAGIAVRDDLKGLRRHEKFKPAGFIELQDYVKKFGIESNGLKKLAAIVLKIKISKSQQISNWDDNKLSVGQLRYAATDGWVCYGIYTRLISYENEYMERVKRDV